MRKEYRPNQDYIRVASATPEVFIGNVAKNVERITELYDEACDLDVCLTTFPELSITGYTIGDLVMQTGLLKDAKEGILSLAEQTKDKNNAIIVGLPLQVRNGLYNTAAFLADGEIKGIVPKANLPTYKEFYEKRWYQAWENKNINVELNGQTVTFGAEQLFKIGDANIGIEICEDLWVPEQRSIQLAAQGAHVIANPSASPEIATKGDYRKQLVHMTAGRLAAGYIFSGADSSESTSDIVMSGHAIISELGRQLAERVPFDDEASRLTIADIDIARINHERRSNSNYPMKTGYVLQQTNITPRQENLDRKIDSKPFQPKGETTDKDKRLNEIFTIQSLGLKQRLEKSKIDKVVIGLSGGLDSTLALLVAINTAKIRDINPSEMIETITMPSFASSKRTQNNAILLSKVLELPNFEIPINEMSKEQLQAIGHDGNTQDLAYENTQARLRTALQFNRGNMIGGLLLGTGDLSENALGWCTYGGDQTSGYNVNASVPKSLVRDLVDYAMRNTITDEKAKLIIADIINTPISPELTGNNDGQLSQETEELIGPYELHDFFLYNFVRWMDSPEKISYQALKAFEGKYEKETIDKWLDVFIKRFWQNQWKRQAMPDGPKVGSVSLSPRGDWRMPPDASLPDNML